MSTSTQGPRGSRDVRLGRIRDLLSIHGRLEVEALAEELRVTTMTIRRDLMEMESEGLLLRVHGGCVLQGSGLVREMSFSEKAGQRVDEKRAIAREAVKLFRRGNAVYLDTGTTTAWVARLLPPGLDLDIFTNNLRAAMDLFGRRDLRLHVLGGRLAPNSPDLIGEAATSRVQLYRTEWAVAGADAVDPATGCYHSADLETAELSRAAQGQANRTLLVVDNSKIGRRGLAVTGRLQAGVTMVTDAGVPADVRATLAAHGATVIYAEVQETQQP